MADTPRKRLLKRGIGVKVRAATGRSPGFVSDVLNQRARPTDAAREVAGKAADIVGVPKHELFPRYFKVA